MKDFLKNLFWSGVIVGFVVACATHLRVGELDLETHTQGVESSE